MDQVGPGGLLTDVALYLDVDQTQIVPQAVPPVASPTNIVNNNNNGGQGITNNNNNSNGGGERPAPRRRLSSSCSCLLQICSCTVQTSALLQHCWHFECPTVILFLVRGLAVQDAAGSPLCRAGRLCGQLAASACSVHICIVHCAGTITNNNGVGPFQSTPTAGGRQTGCFAGPPEECTLPGHEQPRCLIGLGFPSTPTAATASRATPWREPSMFVRQCAEPECLRSDK